MTQDFQTFLYVFGAASCFTLASLFFTKYARQVSATWVNATKASVAGIGLFLACLVFGLNSWLPINQVLVLLLSGSMGLAIGDLFLFSAFAKMGSARTILLYGFQPLIMGIAGFFFFGQSISIYQFTAIFFLLICLGLFAWEKRREKGHWEWKALSFALIGVFMDNSGALLTRWCFEQNHELHPLWANFYRCLGALTFFFIYQFVRPFGWISNLKKLSKVGRGQILSASVLGTILSLYFYMCALRIGNLATLGALGVTAPTLAAVFESLYEKRWPSRFFLAAFGFFIAAVLLLLK